MSQFAVLLETQSARLLERWVNRVAHVGHPDSSTPEHLKEWLPSVVRALAIALHQGEVGAQPPALPAFGFDVAAVVREYGLLATALLELADEAGTTLSAVEVRVFTHFMSALVAEGVAKHEALPVEKERANETAELERLIIGVVSHDLGNPLAVIKLGVGQLLRQEELAAGSRKLVLGMKATLDDMTHLVDDLLDFTQARLGRGLSIVRAPMNLHGLVRRVADALQLRFPNRALQLEQEGDAEGSWDEKRLAQVVANLITNAFKYSPSGSSIGVSTRGKADGVELKVTNTGAPIAAEVLPLLFEPLQQVPGRPLEPGRSMGLGLYIVKHIVDALGGTITVTSTAEAGTCFTVLIPR